MVVQGIYDQLLLPALPLPDHMARKSLSQLWTMGVLSFELLTYLGEHFEESQFYSLPWLHL